MTMALYQLGASLLRHGPALADSESCCVCDNPPGCCCLPGEATASVMTKAECDLEGGAWTAKESPEAPCPGCIGCCCEPEAASATETTKADCDDIGGTWQAKASPEGECPPCPYTKCCVDGDACVPVVGCSNDTEEFLGTVTVSWCGASFTFSYPDLTSVLGGFCNKALGPELPTPTGYSKPACTSICWFGGPAVPMEYKDEYATLFVQNDCITGECPAGVCTCERVRFVIGASLSGALFFDAFAGGTMGWASLSGGSKVWLYTQDYCGRTSLRLLSHDDCAGCDGHMDNCVPEPDPCNQVTNPIRPSFMNPACNFDPVISLNEAP